MLKRAAAALLGLTSLLLQTLPVHSLKSATAPGDDAPLLLELTPNSFNKHVNGSVTALVAFVHPRLPHSFYMHSVLHELNQHYQEDADTLIAFADVAAFPYFKKAFGVKEFPSLMIFGRNLPAKSPIQVKYGRERGALDYVRELEKVSLMGSSLQETLHSGLVKEVQGYLADTVAKEREAAAKLIAEKQRQKKQGSEAAVAADGQVAVDAGVAAAVAAPAASENSSTNTNTTTNSSSSASAALSALTTALTAELQHLDEMHQLRKQRLQYLQELLQAMEGQVAAPAQEGEQTAVAAAAAAAGAGTAVLTRQLNVKNSQLLLAGDFLKGDMRQQLLLEVAVLGDLLKTAMLENAGIQQLRQERVKAASAADASPAATAASVTAPAAADNSAAPAGGGSAVAAAVE